MNYETVIGLEVHLQLATKTKAFCGCSTKFGSLPNSQTCPVCLGFPGSLPVLNEQAFLFSIKVALALDCRIQDLVKFDRKNYYYPDLPKNFQISQYDMPLSYNGSIEIAVKDELRKKIRIRRVHLEEDAGKLIHPKGESYSLVDYNRSGMPLLEVVTEPDMNSPDEAYEYLARLKAILEYLKVSDCDMEKGSLRCDANVSVRPQGSNKLGTKVELKNMNTFKGVRSALEYEVKRQTSALEEKASIVQETRLWNADKQVTTSMRSKEEAEDYRYLPEPDLVPFVVDKSLIQQVRESLPELPEARQERFIKIYEISRYDANVLTSQVDLADYFETCVKLYANPKRIANWLQGDIMAALNEKAINIKELGLSSDRFAGLLKMIDDGSISGKMAKDILREAIETKIDPQEIVNRKGLSQITDPKLIEGLVDLIIKREGKSANDYKAGKTNALTFLIGQIMKESRGKANPALVNEILRKRLGTDDNEIKL
ncbi:MAG: Asp-tRNA(Asn)/Glu-tRNA(Gln) amidotransferase subunit GatB [Candidatus Omnitrophota bacterium]|nr:Asp-tRNA(Asn)/Glu-tRNA(Gln) amidotransferase subunit GatB [Candidatus Omnitrophota bacterium]